MVKTNEKQSKVKREMSPLTRVVTFNVHRALKGYHGKQKAPRAIRELKKMAFKEMGTPKVLVKSTLNIALWQKGIRHVPHKMRIKITRKYDEDEKNSGEMISELEFVPVETFKGLTTQKEA